MAQIIVAEVEAYDPAIYGVRTLRFGTQSFLNGGTPIIEPTLDSRITVTRSGTATRINKLGLVESVAANTPRFDYDPVTKALKGLLVEESRQNILAYSEECYNTAQWGVGSTLANFYTVTNSTDIANIYGTMSGGGAGVAKFVAAASTSPLFLRKTITLAAGTYAPSIFIYVPSQAGLTSWSVNLDAGDTEQNVATTSTAFNRWVRVEMPAFTTAASRSFWDFNIYRNGGSPTPGFTFYAMGAQLEVGAFCTSYIPTAAAAVTRNPEDVAMTGANFSAGWVSATQGTLFAEWDDPRVFPTNAYRIFAGLRQASDNNQVRISQGGVTTSDKILGLAYTNATQAELEGGVQSAGVHRGAFAYAANNFGLSYDGGIVTDSAGSVPTFNLLNIGGFGGAYVVNGHIRRVTYWPTRLTDAQLQALTTGQSIPSGMSLNLDFTTGANSFYEGRIQQPANIKRDCFRDGRTFGQTQIGYGEMVLVNNDGALDELLNYSFAGRKITITLGTMLPNATTPTWTTILTGTMEQVDLSWSRVSVRVRDKQLDIAKPLQEVRYAGTGTLEGGDSLNGKPKPLVYGKVLNVSSPQIDTSLRIYQVSANQLATVDAVYDRGTLLTAGAAYSSQADMLANSPTAGQYRVWNDATAGAFIRLGSAPVGTVTVDATQGAAAANRTVGQLFNAILLKAGVPSTNIVAADITALDAAVNYQVGVYAGYDQDRSAISMLDELCASVGAWYGADANGMFRIGRIVLPTGTEVGTVTKTDIIKIERIASRDPGVGVPSWKVKVAYEKINSVQVDLGASVPESRKQFTASEYRRAQATDATVKTANLLSPELEFKTVLVNKGDAGSEAERLLAIYKQRRDVYQVTVRVDAALASVLDLGKVVKLEINRFGMSAGKKLLIIGITTNMRGYLYELTLWG